jgi:hypothetical protein
MIGADGYALLEVIGTTPALNWLAHVRAVETEAQSVVPENALSAPDVCDLYQLGTGFGLAEEQPLAQTTLLALPL